MNASNSPNDGRTLVNADSRLDIHQVMGRDIMGRDIVTMSSLPAVSMATDCDMKVRRFRVIVRVARNGSPPHAAGALYFENAPNADGRRVSDLQFLVGNPGATTGRSRQVLRKRTGKKAPTAWRPGSIVSP